MTGAVRGKGTTIHGPFGEADLEADTGEHPVACSYPPPALPVAAKIAAGAPTMAPVTGAAPADEADFTWDDESDVVALSVPAPAPQAPLSEHPGSIEEAILRAIERGETDRSSSPELPPEAYRKR